MKNRNIAPYFDDYSTLKNFYRVLFRPGYPVQTRELNQIQSILQNQVKSLGDHLFKNGSMVVPGNTSFDSGIFAVRVTLAELSSDITALENLDLYGESSKVLGTIVKATTVGLDAVLYVKMKTAGVDDSTKVTFENSETVSIYENGGYLYQLGITIDANASTNATLGFINDGIFYIDGYFVVVYKQTVIISNTSKTPTCRVGLIPREVIITENDDSTLFDNATGASNENAPGAHRFKIELVLTVYNEGETEDPTFIQLFQLEEGKLIQLVKNTEYSEIMKTLARRTYEESGNYIVNDYQTSVLENNPIDSNLNIRMTGGLSFVGGYEVDSTVGSLNTLIPKARTTKSLNNTFHDVKIGNFLLVTDAFRLPTTWSYIEFRDEVTATPGTPLGNIIGFAKVRSVEKTSMSNVYKVFIFDAEFAPGKTIYDAASYSEVNALTTKTTANILNYYGIANVTGTFNSVNDIVSQTSTRAIVPVNVNSERILGKKKTAVAWIRSGEQVKQDTTNATAATISSAMIQLPSQYVPILKLPKTAVKETSDWVYVVTRQIQCTLAGNTATVTPSVNETFVDLDRITAWSTFDGSALTVSSSSSGSITVTGTNGTAIVSVNVRKSNASTKVKNKVATGSITYASPTNKTMFSLGKPDVFEILSITEGGNDVKSNFRLVTNQGESLKPSYIELVSGVTGPVSSLTITFSYLDNGTGDFASVDSYTSLAPGEDFIAKIPTVSFSGVGSYALEDCLDFRPTLKDNSVSIIADTTASNTTITLESGYSNGLLTSGIPVYGQGVNATISSISSNNTQFVVDTAPSSSLNDAILIAGFDASTWKAVPTGSCEPIAASTEFQCDFEFYLPRIDSLFINSSGSTEIFSGVPSENPKAPTIGDSELRMRYMDVYVPAYTFNTGSVSLNKYNRRRYTMQDINSLDNRLSNMEEIVALNMLEQNLTSMEIIDSATGLNRFKSGFVVDNFKSHVVIDLEDASICEINVNDGQLQPMSDDFPIELMVVTAESSNVVVKDKYLMLDYTEEVVFDQPAATRDQNINPFWFATWEGSIKLSPDKDIWTENKNIVTTSTINRTEIQFF